MTEEEAKTKACCGPPETGRSNPSAIGREAAARLCTGSLCMAWRGIGDQRFKDHATGKLSARDLTGNGTWVYVEGRCGLAGPQ